MFILRQNSFPQIRQKRQCCRYGPETISSPCSKEFHTRPGRNFKTYERCLKVNGTLQAKAFNCPCGHYFDSKLTKCVAIPGGGEVVHVDYQGQCKNNYKGILSHPTQKQFYYICKDCAVLVVKCPRLKIYDPVLKYCVDIQNHCSITVHDESNGEVEAPRCKGPGRYAVPEYPEFYYMCTEDGDKFYRSIFKCPSGTQYDPDTQSCSESYYSATPRSVTMGWYLESDPYPPCIRAGRFRSNRNCSMYYVCSAKTGGCFYQHRFCCPSGHFFCTESLKCRPAAEVDCHIENNCTNVTNRCRFQDATEGKKQHLGTYDINHVQMLGVRLGCFSNMHRRRRD